MLCPGGFRGYYQNHPEIVEQMIKIHLKATGFNAANKDEAARYMNELTGLDAAVITTSLDEWDGGFVSDPTKITDSVTTFAAIQKDLGYIKSDLTDTDLFDTSFWGKASA